MAKLVDEASRSASPSTLRPWLDGLCSGQAKDVEAIASDLNAVLLPELNDLPSIVSHIGLSARGGIRFICSSHCDMEPLLRRIGGISGHFSGVPVRMSRQIYYVSSELIIILLLAARRFST